MTALHCTGRGHQRGDELAGEDAERVSEGARDRLPRARQGGRIATPRNFVAFSGPVRSVQTFAFAPDRAMRPRPTSCPSWPPSRPSARCFPCSSAPSCTPPPACTPSCPGGAPAARAYRFVKPLRACQRPLQALPGMHYFSVMLIVTNYCPLPELGKTHHTVLGERCVPLLVESRRPNLKLPLLTCTGGRHPDCPCCVPAPPRQICQVLRHFDPGVLCVHLSGPGGWVIRALH